MNIRKFLSSVMQGVFCIALLFGYTELTFAGFTEPLPGEIYKEYSRQVDEGNLWRVTDPNAPHPGAQAFLPNPTIGINGVDLALAIKAELVIDKWGGHLGTQNKRFQVNGNASIMVPELTTTPSNSECYMQEPNVTIPIPLSHLLNGTNTIQGSCDNQSCYGFGWGQWGWYGMTLRIYYNASKPHPTGTITTPTTGSTFVDNPTITASPVGVSGVAKVEFFGFYEGSDYDGDGVYKEWHRSYRRGAALDLQNHLGTATSPPYSVTWNTEWLPDQTPGSVKIMARVKDNNGVWYVMPLVENLTFQRSSGSVRLYKSFNVPEDFWGRSSSNNEFCNFVIPLQDSSAIWTAVRMCLSTWNGTDDLGDGSYWYKVNNYSIPHNLIGVNHRYKYNEVDLPLSVLKTGISKFQVWSNTVSHHGIEINWPGPAFLVKYQNTIPEEVPVQLASFTASIAGNNQIRLDWMTVSETNNFGFEVQKSFGNDNNFVTIPNSFIPGHGTTLEPHHYSFVDVVSNNGRWYYRLKQIDLDGTIHYSEPVIVNMLTSVSEKPVPTEFALTQNYPNPFNPTTKIEYALPKETNVTIQIFNTLGQLVKTLVEARQLAGYHTAEFNATGLGSGIYFYRLTTSEVSFTKKMMLVR